jgi:predicted dehydrogenase
LIHYLIGPIKKIQGAQLESIFSKTVEDAVYGLLQTENDVQGTLSVSWSDETFRKMSTSITVIGSKGKIIADATEMQVYFKTTDCPSGYTKGWNHKNITDVMEPVNFYLRGEEYSAQIDYFIESIQTHRRKTKNSFEDALHTDKVIQEIKSFQFA